MDIRKVLKIFSRYAAVWLLFMLVPTLAGQPEVIIATPCGLILALVAGTGALVSIRGIVRESLTRAEAVLAGAMVGVFEGIVFAVWAPILMVLKEGETVSDAMLLGIAFLFIGVMAGGLVGAILGAIGHGIQSLSKAPEEAELAPSELIQALDNYPPRDKMPMRKYAFEKGGPERLEISWKGNWENTTIYLDGKEIGSIATQEELREGREFPLPDGSTLQVQLARGFLDALDLRVSRNGKPLPEVASEQVQKVIGAYVTIFFVAGLNVLAGVAAVLLQSEFLRRFGFGESTVAFGVIYIILGFLVMKRKSPVALSIAAALFALDSILGMVLSARRGISPSILALILRVSLLGSMLQGYGALQELKKAQASWGSPQET